MEKQAGGAPTCRNVNLQQIDSKEKEIILKKIKSPICKRGISIRERTFVVGKILGLSRPQPCDEPRVCLSRHCAAERAGPGSAAAVVVMHKQHLVHGFSLDARTAQATHKGVSPRGA